MRKLLLAAAAVLATAAFSFAQEIRDIQTEVYLFRDGSAMVAQRWDVTVTEGTEWYIPIDNPGKSYIRDLNVYENGQKYVSEGREWNSNRSLEAKTGRCGIVEKGGGNIELCWGQGEYGDHVYTISYIIDNLVQSYPECDGFHWHFLNDEWTAKPQHASVKLMNETDGEQWFHENKDSCNVRFWGFGMIGDSWMDEKGNICFESTEPLQYRSFFSALVQFDKGLFNPQVEADGTFEELKETAMKGSDYGEKEDWEEKAGRILGIIIFIFLPIIFVMWLIYEGLKYLWRKTTGNRYRKDIFGKSKIDTWYRDVPMNGNPVALYSLIQSGDYLSHSDVKAFPNVVSAYFLKWIQDGLVRVEKDPKKETRVNLRFVKTDKEPVFEAPIEKQIYDCAVLAAGDDLLEADEFKKWSYKNDRIVTSWPNEARYWGRDNGWKPLSQEERCHAIEFMNYLNDFTLTNEREAPEVGVWKKYMIIAASLGIADKVAKNFEKLFPKVMEEYARQTNMYDTMTTYYVLGSLNNSSRSMMSSALNHQAQREAARRAQERRSGGGGGSISFGGGGGGFGGGHGGGSR